MAEKLKNNLSVENAVKNNEKDYIQLRRVKREQKKKQILESISEIHITGMPFGDEEFKELEYLFENKDKIIRNKEIIDSIK